MNSPVVKFSNVSKAYSMYKKKSDKLLEILSFKKNDKSFSALSNVSFEVFKGETIGIIGINGSGKSTLSSILAQVTPQTSGDIYIDGETSLVAISVGLNNQLTGLENIELKCLMHGLTKKQIKEITPDIIEFADIGDFINQPLKSYSSGMKSRLGFAISAHIQPDILVIDEALSVGDSTFYQKCLDKFDEFKEQGKTIFFISHSLSQVKNISDRILWLNFGEVKMFGDKNEVANKYSEFIKWFNKLNKQEQKKYRKEMLTNQMNVKELGNQSSGNIYSRSRTRKKSKKSLSYIFQIGLLLLLFICSTLLMFVEHPVEDIIGKFENPNNMNNQVIEKTETDQYLDMELNTLGYILVQEGTIYQDANLENELTQLPFASKVNVLGESNKSVYKVSLKNSVGFIQSNKVKLMKDEEELKESSITLEDFLPMFPKQFKESYSFFFTFLNTEYDEIKDKLQGLTNEYIDNFDRPVLEYGYNDISYIFNNDFNSTAIQINNLSIDEELLSEIINETMLSSKDDQLFYIVTSSYVYYLDAKNGTLTVELIQ